jgi:hypothetical protein
MRPASFSGMPQVQSAINVAAMIRHWRARVTKRVSCAWSRDPANFRSAMEYRQPLASCVCLVCLGLTGAARAHPGAAFFDGGLIRFEATINAQPASLLFDTGASDTVLFAAGAERLKLESKPAGEARIAGQMVAAQVSKEVEIGMFGVETKTRLRILPLAHRCDGVLGWRSVTPGDAWQEHRESGGQAERAIGRTPERGGRRRRAQTLTPSVQWRAKAGVNRRYAPFANRGDGRLPTMSCTRPGWSGQWMRRVAVSGEGMGCISRRCRCDVRFQSPGQASGHPRSCR